MGEMGDGIVSLKRELMLSFPLLISVYQLNDDL